MGRLNAPYPIFYIQYPKISSDLILIPAPNIDVSPPYLALPHQTSKPFLIFIFILNSLRPHLPLDPLIRLAQPILQPGVWFPAHQFFDQCIVTTPAPHPFGCAQIILSL